jgi:amidase
MHADEYTHYDAVGLAEQIRLGNVSAMEVVQAAIDHAEQVNPQINAIAYSDFENARVSAESADLTTLLGGVPTFIKDNENVEGWPTRQGSHSMPKEPVGHTSEFAKQFLSTGLIPLGKSTLPEFGLTCTTESELMGPTRNPRNLDYSTGGSSGGSAALVASGVVPIAHGNDGGGSIRIPASCCNLIGLKSSRGRLHHAEGTEKLPINLVSEGVLTRTVRDTATFLAAAEKHWNNPALPALGLLESATTKRLRIGIFTTIANGDSSHPDVVSAVEHTANLCSHLGHHIEAMQNPYDDTLANDFLVYWGMIPYGLKWFGKREFGRDFDSSHFDPWLKGLMKVGRNNLLRFPWILSRLKRFSALYQKLFDEYDLILTPTLSQPPVPIGQISPDVPFEKQLNYVTAYCGFTPFQNLTGTPAISLPIGRSKEGLPIGVQFAASMGDERMLLELAYELEEAKAWNTAPTILKSA